jgi:hypothetical protein
VKVTFRKVYDAYRELSLLCVLGGGRAFHSFLFWGHVSTHKLCKQENLIFCQAGYFASRVEEAGTSLEFRQALVRAADFMFEDDIGGVYYSFS